MAQGVVGHCNDPPLRQTYFRPMRILIVEDDPVLGDGIERSLAAAGYGVDRVDSGTAGDAALAGHDYDLAILDLGLPGLDGLEVLRRLRHRGGRAPVLILTARDAVGDRVTGLDLGADDYLVKPFDLAELEARARALLRRGQFGASPQVTLGPLVFDSVGRCALVNGTALDLSAREVGVLEMLLARSGAGGLEGDTGRAAVALGRRDRRQCGRGLCPSSAPQARAFGLGDPHHSRTGIPD